MRFFLTAREKILSTLKCAHIAVWDTATKETSNGVANLETLAFRLLAHFDYVPGKITAARVSGFEGTPRPNVFIIGSSGESAPPK